MNLGEAARFWGIPQQKIQAPSGASPHMQALIEALNARPHVFKEREAIKNVKEPLDRLKSAPAEEQLAFVFEALAALGTRASMSLHIVLKGVISHLLRAGLPLNSLHAFRMVELARTVLIGFTFHTKRCFLPSKM